MSLDPAASPWPGVIASVGVCLWIAVIGALIAYAVFRDRPRLVWPFYAPAVGIAVVLLVTNLATYVIPGAPAAWFGLLAPLALGVAVVRRSGPQRALPAGSRTALVAMSMLAVGAFVLAYTNRPHVFPHDTTWHYALVFRLARGEFPPVSPFGFDAAIGYHYGADLLAASIVNVSGAFPWTALDALSTLLVVALVLAAAGFAYDVGAPLALALGVGAAIGFFESGAFVGYRNGYFEGLGLLESPHSAQLAFVWTSLLQRPMGVICVVLVAASLQAGTAKRQAALLAVAAGLLPLASAAVMIFACAALALVGVARLVGLRGRERVAITAALGVSALLVLLAGGPVSDALFDRGGTAANVRAAWEPAARDLLPFERAGPVLVKVGVIPLIVIGAFAAWRRRSWGLAFLAAAGAFGLLQMETLQSRLAYHDDRILWLAQVVALLAALAGAGALLGAVRGSGRRNFATLALGLLVILPTALPRAVGGVHLALRELEHANPLADASGHHYRDRIGYHDGIEANWELYDWLRRSLPAHARLLTPHSGDSASASGVAAPFSGGDFQIFNSGNTTWVYQDALRFLHRDDLADMGITHLHVTDKVELEFAPSARRLLDDASQFRLLVDLVTSSGARHRVYEVRPGAGATAIAPTSYRALRQVAAPQSSVTALGSLSRRQHWAILSAFAGEAALQSSIETQFERGTLTPYITTLSAPPQQGVAVLAEPLEPTALGVARAEALWTGHGLRAYDLAAAWSPVWRIGPDRANLPVSQRAVCESANGQVDLHVLGEPGTLVTAGAMQTVLTGLPQVVRLMVPDCSAFALSADSGIAPFVQIRPRHAGAPRDPDAPIAGLGFDGGVDGERLVLNFWFRNPEDISFTTGTEFRLYDASSLGVDIDDADPNPRTASLRWWPGPIALHPPEQIVRVEFDARRLEINGDSGGGAASELVPGRTYLLALTVAGPDWRYGLVEIQHVVPLARVVVGETGVAYEVLSGIVTIAHHEPGTVYQRTGYDGGLTENPNSERR